MPYMVASSFLGLGKEVTRGTPIAPTVYLPVDAPDDEQKVTWLKDAGLRGSPVDNYGDVPGVISQEITYKGNVFPDTIQHLFLACLGGPDTKTGSGPYAHAIPLLNNAATGSQPPSYTLVDYDGTDQARKIAGAQMDTLDLTFGADAAMTWAAKSIGFQQVNESAPTPSFSTELFVPAWSNVASIGGSPFATVETGELNFARSTAAIFTAGQQNAFSNFAGPLALSGKMTFVYEAENAGFLSTGTWSKEIIDLLFTEPQSGDTVEITMSQVQFEDPKITRGKTYVELDVTIMAEANTTDAVTGYSPVTTVTTNSVSAAA